MRWMTVTYNRTAFVSDSGRILVELMVDTTGVTEIISVEAGSTEFRHRLKPKDMGGQRFIDLAAAKEYIEKEWTVDGDSEEAPEDEDR